jgi:hypothetical protein
VYYPEEAFGASREQRQGVYDIATRGCFLWQLPTAGKEGNVQQAGRTVGKGEEL